MASAEQLKALLRSHLEGDDDRFFSVAMQVAAHEVRLGHGKLAEELRAMIDDTKGRRGASPSVPIGRPRGELENLLEASYPKARLGDMILNNVLAELRLLSVLGGDRPNSLFFADEADLEEVYNTERHLLYVACTRARDCLLVTEVDPASEFLDDLN